MPANVDEFADEWSIAADDLRLWVCLHEITHHAVLGVPHVRAALDDLLGRYVAGFAADPSALEERLGDLDMTDPASLAGLQDVLGDPRGAPRRHPRRPSSASCSPTSRPSSPRSSATSTT